MMMDLTHSLKAHILDVSLKQAAKLGSQAESDGDIDKQVNAYLVLICCTITERDARTDGRILELFPCFAQNKLYL